VPDVVCWGTLAHIGVKDECTQPLHVPPPPATPIYTEHVCAPCGVHTHGGQPNSNKFKFTTGLMSENVVAPSLLSCRRSHHINVDEAMVLDMGQYMLPGGTAVAERKGAVAERKGAVAERKGAVAAAGPPNLAGMHGQGWARDDALHCLWLLLTVFAASMNQRVTVPA
jgi:hypothetical protein